MKDKIYEFKKKIIASILIVFMMLNISEPLLITAYATETVEKPDKPGITFEKEDIETADDGETKYFKMDVYVTSPAKRSFFTNVVFSLFYDNTKVVPVTQDDPTCESEDIDDTWLKSSSVYETTDADEMMNLNTSEHWFTVFASSKIKNGTNTVKSPYDVASKKIKLGSLIFKLVDDTLTDETMLNTKIFTPRDRTCTGGVIAPAEIGYSPDPKVVTNQDEFLNSIQYSQSADWLSLVGVGSVNSKTVTSVAVKNNPTTMSYEHGDTINLAGGVITVNYDDSTSEDIEMTKPSVSMTSSATADVNSPNIKLSYGGKEVNIPITVTDPVIKLSVTSPMTKTEYNQDDIVDFTGLQLAATKKSGAIENLTQSSANVSTSETTADVNSSNFTLTSAEGVTPKKGIQKLVFSYGGKTAYSSIIVNDKVTGITVVQQPIKCVYKRGESLDLTGAKVKINTQSGAEAQIDLPDGSISVTGYNANTTGSKQNLAVNYGSIQATATIDVEAYNYVKSSTLTTPQSYYKYNEDLNTEQLVLNLNYQDGTSTSISSSSSEFSNIQVTGYNKTTIGKQTLTVTYPITYTLSDGTKINDIITNTFNVQVENSAKSIAITKPTGVTFLHGSTLTFNGGNVAVTRADNTVKNYQIDSNMVTETATGTEVNMSPASYDGTNKVTKNLTISYSEDDVSASETYDINIINDIKSIAVSTDPKTEYNVNDTLDLTSGEIEVTRAVGEPTKVSMSDPNVSVTGFNSTVENTALPLTVKYIENGVEQSTTYNIHVSDSVKSISLLATPDKTTYKYGDILDVTGGKLTVVKGSGTYTVNIENSMITGYKPETLGQQELTVTYGGKTVKYNVTVEDELEDITLVQPTKLSYNYGESLNLDGGSVTKVMKSKTPQTSVALTDESVTVSGYDPNKVGTQEITVTYGGISKKFNVSVNDELLSIEMNQNPSKTTYKYDEPLVVTGGKIKATKGSGVAYVDITDEMVSGYNAQSIGTNPVTVTYGGKSTTFNVTVEDYVTDITFTAPGKTIYKYGTDLDLTGGSVQKVMKSGTTQPVINLPSDEVTVSGYNPNYIGTQTITVAYAGIEKTYSVEVQNGVKAIDITTPTTTTYNNGDTLSVSGGNIKVTYLNNTVENKAVTTDMIKETISGSAVNMSSTEYSSTNKITKNLTITYIEDGITKTANYDIDLINNVESINVHTMPKNKYNVNEPLDLTNGEVKVNRAVGDPEVLSMSNTNVNVTGFNSSVENTMLPLTVTYTENGISKTTSYNVEVEDTVTSIVINTIPSKTDYKYGEELDVTGGKIDVTKGSGTTTLDMTNGMVSGFNSHNIGNQSLVVTYGGKTTTYAVIVSDYLDDIELTAPTKLTYKYGDELDLSNGSIKKVMKSEAPQESVPLTDSSVTVTGYNANTLGSQTITVSYAGMSKTFVVTVENAAKTIDITAPTKTTYNNGDTLSVTGGNIKVTYLDNTVVNKNVTADMIKETVSGSVVNMSSTEYGPTNKITKNLTITYTENGITNSKSYDINLINDVKSIEVTTLPKALYNVNDSLELTNGEIKVTRAVGTSEIVQMTDSKVAVTGYDSSIENLSLPLTVTYTENDISKTTTYNVAVKDSVKSITISTTPKVDYLFDEELDVTGGKLDITRGSGTTTINMTSPMVTGYNPKTIGQQQLTVTYGGKTTTYNVDVEDYVTDITLTQPTKTTYIYGESLDLTGGTVQKVMKSGTIIPAVDLDESNVNVSDYDATSLSTQTITVNYAGKSKTFDVTVEDEVIGINLTQPTKTSYKLGEGLDLTGGTVQKVMKSGTIIPAVGLDSEGVSVSGYDANKKGSQTITISYAGKTKTYEVNVEDYVTDIILTAPSKTNYKFDDALDLTGGTVQKVMKSGDNIPAVSLNSSEVTVSGYNAKTLGKQTITVAYAGKTKTYDVTVEDEVTDITLTQPTKVSYKFGEELDLTNGTVQKVMKSGTIIPDVSLSNSDVTVSGFNGRTLGTQTITVTYAGKTKTFDVTVEDYVDDITLVAPTKLIYNYGDTLDLTGGTVQKVMKGGTIIPAVSLDSDDVTISNFNANQMGTQTLTVIYAGKTKIFDVTVKNSVKSIDITEPTKKSYNDSDALSLEGGKITLTYLNNETSEKALTLDMIKETTSGTAVNMSLTTADYGTTNKVTKNLTISYSEDKISNSKTYDIDIINNVESIAVGTTPKSQYDVNETLNVVGGTITVTRAVGTPETVAMDDSRVNVTGFDSSIERLSLPLTVEFTENGITKTTSYNVKVIDEVVSVGINQLPSKVTYGYGELLDVTGGKIKITKDSGSRIIPLSSDMVSGYNPNQVGTQILTVNYGGKSTTYTVEVVDEVTDITLVAPTKVTYNYGEELDLTNGTVQKVMRSGTIIPAVSLDNSDVTISGYNKNTLGAQTITVSYAEKTKTFSVQVNDYVISTEIVKPTKTTYKYGENIDKTNGKIIKKWASERADDIITLEDSMFTESDGSQVNMMPTSFDSNNLVSKTLKITYEEQTKDYPITIINDIKSLAIKNTPKTKYNLNDELDKSTGSVEVTRANNTKEEIPLSSTKLVVTGFDSSKVEENVPVTVEYTENGIKKSTIYIVSIKDDVQSINIQGTPKSTYKYGSAFDISGLTLKVTKPSGVVSIPVTMNMISGYNATKLGTQTITVTYSGVTTSYDVVVEDYLKDVELTKPTKTIYKLNEELDLTGASLTEVYASGKKVSNIDVTKSMVTSLDSSEEGTKELTVTYVKGEKQFKKTFTVQVIDTIDSISINNLKDTYKYGENLDLTNTTLSITKQSGEVKTVPVTKDMISGYTVKPDKSKFDTNDEYKQTIKITYTENGQTKELNSRITTKDFFNKITVAGLKTNYEYGDNLDVDDASVSKVSASGRVLDTVPLVKDLVTGFDSHKVGTQTLTIEYEGKQVQKNVNVTDNIQAVIIVRNPTKTEYVQGDSIDVTGGKLKVVRRSGITEIDITKDMLKPYDLNNLGIQAITVEYEGKTADFSVLVNAKAEINNGQTGETVATFKPTRHPVSKTDDEYDYIDSDSTNKTEEGSKDQNTEDKNENKDNEETKDNNVVIPSKDNEKTNDDKENGKVSEDELTLRKQRVTGIERKASVATLVIALLALIIVLFRKKNTTIFEEQDDKMVKVGSTKLSMKNNSIELDKYTDTTKSKLIRIVLNKSISKTLDDTKVVVTYNKHKKQFKVKYNDEKFEIELKI